MSLRILSSCCFRQASMRALKIIPRPCNIRLISSIPASRASVDVSPIQTAGINLQLCRFKSKNRKKGSKQQEEADDDDDNENEAEDDVGDEDGTLPGEKERILKVGVVRTDKVLKLATNSARIIEEAFLEGKIYKNESKLLKKSSPIQVGDILDVEIGPDAKNPDFIKVHRVEIKEIKEGVHSYVKILYSKNLTIKRHSS